MGRDHIKNVAVEQEEYETTITELIKTLEKIKKEFGDISVKTSEYPGSRNEVDVQSVDVYRTYDGEGYYVIL